MFSSNFVSIEVEMLACVIVQLLVATASGRAKPFRLVPLYTHGVLEYIYILDKLAGEFTAS